MADARLERFVLVATLSASAFGCTADRPGGDNLKPDAGVADVLKAPTLEVPMSTPNGTVAVRGSSDGTRIVVKGTTGDPVVRSVLPSGGFCLDVPLEDGENLFSAFALKNGDISPSAPFTVTKDPAAPIPANPMCAGMEEPVCVAEDSASSNCANGADDNCNGYTDECDPTCNGCMDDAFGPNWSPFYVPMIMPGTYDMYICPCRSDWFAFQVPAGGIVHVRATFTQATLDLDMILQTPMAAEDGVTTSVARSTTTTSAEEINFTSTAGGLYYLKIYPYKAGQIGPYKLTVY